MTIVVIGSYAMNHHIPGHRTPSDLDIVAPHAELNRYKDFFGARTYYPTHKGKKVFMRTANGDICEAEVAWKGSSAEALYNLVLDDPNTQTVTLGGTRHAYPSLNFLYMLKMSHRYLKDSPHFLKTMADIKMLRSKGAVIQPEHEAFYQQRMADTYVYSHPDLSVDKATFFDAEATGVPYVYDHDSIHEAIRTLPVPAYTLFAEPGHQVKSSEVLFWQAGHDVRIRAGMEESMVLAIERSLVPYPDKMTPTEAFLYSLMKVCTSVTSGWFREFVWESYDEIVELQKEYHDYYDQFQKGLASGIVKPYNGSLYTKGEVHA